MVGSGQKRYLFRDLEKDLAKKMVFVGGPRQVGKTTLALALGGSNPEWPPTYFNWDFDEHRRLLLSNRLPATPSTLILDDIHKYGMWKSFVKGLYDTQRAHLRILVTGSARLDVFRRGGDSLLGRSHYWRLHPFGLDEIPAGMTASEALGRLMTVGGFPEPFLDGDVVEAKRWRRQRLQRVVRDDIRDLEPIRNMSGLELFLDSLRQRVGGSVVLSNIAGDLQVAPKTLAHWLTLFEKMYLVFVVKPFVAGVPRAIQKPPKVYFFDNADVIGDDGARFENLIASHLLKRIHFLEDSKGDTYGLHYLRDKDKREVDFVVTRDGMVDALIEVKLRDTKPSTSLLHFASKLRPRRVVQIVAEAPFSTREGNVDIVPAREFFADIRRPL
jgi:predicted AAA+ superfamily ATPase